MSELKVYHCNEWHNEYTEFYMKDEAYKVITHNKYKRCLAMAMWCKSKSEIYNEFAADASEYMPSYEARFRSKAVLYQKWAMRWLKLAEKFKEAKNAED